MKIFNTLTRTKEEFVPMEEGKVKLYACGPTVYNYFHLGNARPFVTFDTLRRYLEYRGYDVTFCQNFTDIDDKMIKRANEEGTTVKDIADRYIAESSLTSEYVVNSRLPPALLTRSLPSPSNTRTVSPSRGFSFL